MNLYAYVANNPITARDPLGLLAPVSEGFGSDPWGWGRDPLLSPWETDPYSLYPSVRDPVRDAMIMGAVVGVCVAGEAAIPAVVTAAITNPQMAVDTATNVVDFIANLFPGGGAPNGGDSPGAWFGSTLQQIFNPD